MGGAQWVSQGRSSEPGGQDVEKRDDPGVEGIRTSAPDTATARLAARRRALGVSLADGFAIATAERLEADLASFDRRVRRALEKVGPRLSTALSD